MPGDRKGFVMQRVFGRELPAWKINLYILVLVVFTSFVGFNFASPFLPLYVRELGVTDPTAVAVWSGAILAVAPFASAFASPLWGALADRLGRRRLLIQTVFGFGVCSALMALVDSVPQLFFLRLAMGLTGGFTSIVMTLAVTATPREQVTRSIGLVQSAQIISLAVGPALGGLVADRFGLRASFLVATALCLGVVAILWFFFTEPAKVAAPAPARSNAPRSGFGWAALLRTPLLLPLLAVLFLAQFADKSFGPLVPLAVPHLDVTPESYAVTSGFIIGAGAIAAAVSANLVGRLVGRWSHGQVLLGAFILAAIGCAAMAGIDRAWQLGALRVWVGLSAGGTLTLAYAKAGAVIPAEHRGSLLGLLTSAVMIGSAASPLGSGLLAAWSLPGAFLALAGLCAVAAAIVLTCLREPAAQTARANAPHLAGSAAGA